MAPVKILVVICFEYKTNKLVYSCRDVKTMVDVYNFEKKLLFTDLGASPDYSETHQNPSIELVINKLNSIDPSAFVVVYVGGHGTFNGLRWHDETIIDCQKLVSSVFQKSLFIFDMCHCDQILLPYTFNNTTMDWNTNNILSESIFQICFSSSVKGISSKMTSQGSVYTRTLIKMLKRRQDFETIVSCLIKKFPLSSVSATTNVFTDIDHYFSVANS